MMAFIDQEASEKAEEIDAKVRATVHRDENMPITGDGPTDDSTRLIFYLGMCV